MTGQVYRARIVHSTIKSEYMVQYKLHLFSKWAQHDRYPYNDAAVRNGWSGYYTSQDTALSLSEKAYDELLGRNIIKDSKG